MPVLGLGVTACGSDQVWVAGRPVPVGMATTGVARSAARALTLDISDCAPGVRYTARVTEDATHVNVLVTNPSGVAALPMLCAGMVSVRLKAPLGVRTVVDVSTHASVPVKVSGS